MNDDNGLVCTSFVIETEVRVTASREVVFAAITTYIGRWWTYRILGPSYGIMMLEPHVDGRFFEDGGDGTGALWGHVLDYVPSKLLRLSGPMGERTPIDNLWEYKLEEEAGVTLVKIKHQAQGLMACDSKQVYLERWNRLCEALQQYAEVPARI